MRIQNEELEGMRIGAVQHISRLEWERPRNKEQLEYYWGDRLRHLIAAHVAHTEMSVVDEGSDEFVTMRMDLIVATPEEFFKLLNKMATELAYRMRPMELPGDKDCE